MQLCVRMVVAVFLVSLVGCSRSPVATYPVAGTVTIDGEPLPTGTVLFESVDLAPDGKQYTARAAIQADGTYVLGTFEDGDGAAAGDHSVSVLAPKPGPPRDTGRPTESLIPYTYNDAATSGLRFTVAEETNSIDLELSSKPIADD